MTEQITATLKNSLRVLANDSISEKSPLTVGVLCRWCRTLRAWDLQLFHSVKALRICHRQLRN